MKFIVLVLMLVFFLTPSVFAQKRKPARKSGAAIARVSRPALPSVMTICVNDRLPKGYWIVRETFDSQCPLVNNYPRALVISLDGTDSAGAAPAVASRGSAGSNSSNDDSDIVVRVEGGRYRSNEEKEKTANEKRAEEAVRQATFENAIRERTIRVGMTMEQVVRAWGQPQNVIRDSHTVNSSSGENRYTTWRFDGGRQSATVEFYNAIVSSWAYTK
jgi:hypothetical protein